MDRSLVLLFCLESTIPGVSLAVKSKDEKMLVASVTEKAHRDTMTGARFHDSEYYSHSKEYISLLVERILSSREDLSSVELIKELYEFQGASAKIGSLQKLVNMTLKYLYVIEVCGFSDFCGYKINLKNCDCPLDSVVLSELSEETGNKYTPWTKISDLDDYNDIQKDIPCDEGRLEYDFEHWGSKAF